MSGKGIVRTSPLRSSRKFAPGFRRWHHACGGKGCPTWEVGQEGEDLVSYLGSLIRRYPLMTFFVLAYALSWWPWVLYALDLYPAPIASFGPFLAALVVLAITQGKSGIGGLLRRMVRWRVGLRWYAVALLLPVGIALAATALNVLLGARAPSAADLGGWTGLFSTFAVVLLIPGIGGGWEGRGRGGGGPPPPPTGPPAPRAPPSP